MRFLLTLLGVVTSATGLSAAEPQPLFNGRDLSGWEFIGTPTAADISTVCTVQADGVIAAAGQPIGFIATMAPHANYRLHAEWRWPGKPGNGGVLLHISSGPKDRAWPLCFQMQTKNKSAGDLLPMAGATFAEALTSPAGAAAARAHAAADSENPAGEWNSCDITCRGGTIEVTINGVLQNSVTGCALQGGKIGFQFEGVPFELRRATVVALD